LGGGKAPRRAGQGHHPALWGRLCRAQRPGATRTAAWLRRRGRVAAGGAARQPVRPVARHRGPGVGEASPRRSRQGAGATEL